MHEEVSCQKKCFWLNNLAAFVFFILVFFIDQQGVSDKHYLLSFFFHYVLVTCQNLYDSFAILPRDKSFLMYDINYELWICKGDGNSIHVSKKTPFQLQATLVISKSKGPDKILRVISSLR